MRLLDSSSLELREFLPGEVPPYAILSHTWGKEEVSFQEMQHPNGEVQNKAGFNKIKRCCDVAANDGFDYVWIDTCCIDKTSSSELSEAINSMFTWYKKADVCYAFLSDVSSGLDSTALGTALRNSRWFTRGWTLQELIAPACVIFLDEDWKELGTKSGLRDVICAITSIHVDVLLGQNIERFSIAQRMSWASRRTTTIDEDIAYCLMGIFQINMPLLYGEGGNAFMRLQEEIIRRSDDHSIFAWQDSIWSFGMLARSPKVFQDSRDIVRVNSVPAEPFALTNKGIHLKLPLRIFSEEEEPGMYFESALKNGISIDKKAKREPNEPFPIIYMVVLDCYRLGKPESQICLYLETISRSSKAGFDEETTSDLERQTLERSENLGTIQLHDRSKFQARSFYVRPYNEQPIRRELYAHNPFFIQIATLARKGLHLCESNPEILSNGIQELHDDYGDAALRLRDPDGDEFVIVLQNRFSFIGGGYKRLLSAHVYLLSQEEDPKQPLWKFRRNMEEAEIQKPPSVLEPEGVIWKQPNGRSMNLVLRRQVLSGERRILVDFNCERPGLYAKEGRKATIMVN